ncbi:unnamed protein product [Ilex paraguariensis]|uniref:Cytochrome P450 n=1 Tax=Ilex paraguariensis TaxID=185542 RepID=A0ABC8RY43_9AQUA
MLYILQDLLMRCTLNSIFRVGFGVDLNCLEGSNKEGSLFIKAFDDSNALIYCRYVDPFWKLNMFLNIGSEASLKKNIKIIFDLVDKLIRTKREQLEMQQNCVGNEGGTSSIEDIVTKLNDEILEKMHYLHATLTETLRLYPTVLVDGRIAEKDDILPDGFRLKKGDVIYYMSYAMGKMSDIWGDDAHNFRPERWLNNGFFQSESPFKFIAFHVCDIIYPFIF